MITVCDECGLLRVTLDGACAGCWRARAMKCAGAAWKRAPSSSAATGLELLEPATGALRRVCRLVVYEGPAERVEATLARSLPEGVSEWRGLKLTISSVPNVGPASRLVLVGRPVAASGT